MPSFQKPLNLGFLFLFLLQHSLPFRMLFHLLIYCDCFNGPYLSPAMLAVGARGPWFCLLI